MKLFNACKQYVDSNIFYNLNAFKKEQQHKAEQFYSKNFSQNLI